jgi:hypothetical protein
MIQERERVKKEEEDRQADRGSQKRKPRGKLQAGVDKIQVCLMSSCHIQCNI